MKKIIVTFFLMILLQSCSHIISYKESDYAALDSPYSVSSMRFSYHADGHTIESNLQNMGNRVFNNVLRDKNYKNCLQSAVDYENQWGENKEQRNEYDAAIKVASNYSPKANNNRKQTAQETRSILSKLENVSIDFSDYWKRIFQLSHRGIIQHYLSADVTYTTLSSKEKALVYGYILDKDASECTKLGTVKAENEKSTQMKLQSKINNFLTESTSISTSKCVDLGLSVYWCGYNFGASAPEYFGGWYLWGDTERRPKWGTYEAYNWIQDHERYKDNLWAVHKDLTYYDVVAETWGDGWMTPSQTQMQELLDKCEIYAVTYKNVKGYKVVGPNGNSIFLLADGQFSYLLRTYRYYQSEIARGKYVPDVAAGACLRVNANQKEIELGGIPRDLTGVIRPVKVRNN